MALLFLAGFLFCFPCAASTQQEEYQKAFKYLQEDDFNKAIDVLQGILDKDPNQAQAYNILGLVYLRQGESVQSAIGSFEQAVHIDPKYADAYFNLASAYASQGTQPLLAAQNFKKTLEVDPNFVRAHFGLGWFMLTTNQNAEEASIHFRKTIDAFPDFSEAYYALGLCYVQMGKSPLALDLVTQLRAMNREDLATYLESAIRGESPQENVDEERPLQEESFAASKGDEKLDFLSSESAKADFLLDLSDQKKDTNTGMFDLEAETSSKN